MEPSTTAVPKKSFFSYAENLPVLIRISAFLLFLGGALGIGFLLVPFFIGSAPALNPVFWMSLVQSVYLLVVSHGLAQLKKWSLYLWLAGLLGIVALSFMAGSFSVALLVQAGLFIASASYHTRFS